ncbi:MAG: hypothetical protein US13_C0002G0159 [candidate division TM6 bacterium GW2011_GWE2_36_25]|nr:MAG: hypothetical protein US03_C0002G0160 [candidate division TM6 bacterium GW2011_GWF2_36_131]KKQ03593.1 MAG: hypothetical protein US13_C0002G0159 [candidate division TM6 bacterium GW2011_GWE2_36_25]KKQ20130.1 MAG: hypothetical protein US32_C0001G0027 [candidate division TM6 bacterium GW2011_GWA2_36_9]
MEESKKPKRFTRLTPTLDFKPSTRLPVGVSRYAPITTLDMFREIIDPFTTGLHPNTIAVFDIDDTVGIPWGPEILTSEAFEENQYAAKILFPDTPQDKLHAKKITELLEAHKNAELRPFDEENTISKKIKLLQDNGIKVIGLTARSTPLRDDTLRQLKKLKIKFDYDKLQKPIPIRGTTEQIGIFTHGILFCGNNSKGPMLKSLFGKLEFEPEEIIYADDSSRNIESVLNTFPKKTIPLFMQLPAPTHDDESDERLFDDHVQIGDRSISMNHLFKFLVDALIQDPESIKHHSSMRSLDLDTSMYSSASSDGSLSPTGSPTRIVPLTCHALPEHDPFAPFRSPFRSGKK